MSKAKPVKLFFRSAFFTRAHAKITWKSIEILVFNDDIN